MDKLSIEIAEAICSFLDVPDLLSAQVVSRSFQAASTPALYKNACLSNITGAALLDTLDQHPSLRSQVKSIDLGPDFKFRETTPSDPLDAVLLPLVTHCKTLRSLRICWMDSINAIDCQFFDSLISLPLITTFALSTMPARIPIKRILPALAVWAPRLRSLALSGIYETLTSEDAIDMEPLEMPYLSHLVLGTCEILDAHFIHLFGKMERLQTVDLALLVANAPSDEAVYQALARTGSTITDLKIEKAWHSSLGREDSRLGQQVVSKCRAGVLKSLSLSGATFNSDLLKLEQLSQVKEFELTCITALQASLCADLLAWMKENKRPVKLEKLMAYIVDYEQNVDEEARQALAAYTAERWIEFAYSVGYG